ncbi:MAG: hypothetical protein Q8L85_10045 [Alphaproteobacteria bacterium]|nr:hypothetical protein [Alphaproteobacteria bacterium]
MKLHKLLTMAGFFSAVQIFPCKAVMIKFTGLPLKVETLPNNLIQVDLDQFILQHSIQKLSLRFINTKDEVLEEIITSADNIESQFPEKFYNWKSNFIESTKQPLTIKLRAQKNIDIPLDWDIKSIECSYNNEPYQEAQRLFEGQVISDLARKENATLYIKSKRYLYADTGNPPNVIPQTPGEQIIFTLSD